MSEDLTTVTIGSTRDSRRPRSAQLIDPLVGRDHVGLSDEDLVEQHVVDLGVGVGTAVAQHGEAVVEVGRLAERRQDDPTCPRSRPAPARRCRRIGAPRRGRCRRTRFTRFLTTTTSPSNGATAGWICVAAESASKIADAASAENDLFRGLISGEPDRTRPARRSRARHGAGRRGSLAPARRAVGPTGRPADPRCCSARP